MSILRRVWQIWRQWYLPEHTSRLGYDASELSNLIPLGIGSLGKVLVRVLGWGGFALGSSGVLQLAGLFPSQPLGGVASENAPPAKVLAFWRHRFCFIVSRLSKEDLIASALAALAQDKMYSWTHMSSIARKRS